MVWNNFTCFIISLFPFSFTLNTKFQEHYSKKHLFYYVYSYSITQSNRFWLIVWLPTWSGIFGHLSPESACVTSIFEISILEIFPIILFHKLPLMSMIPALQPGLTLITSEIRMLAFIHIQSLYSWRLATEAATKNLLSIRTERTMNHLLGMDQRIPQESFYLIQKTTFTDVQRNISRRMQMPIAAWRGT